MTDIRKIAEFYKERLEGSYPRMFGSEALEIVEDFIFEALTNHASQIRKEIVAIIEATCCHPADDCCCDMQAEAIRKLGEA